MALRTAVSVVSVLSLLLLCRSAPVQAQGAVVSPPVLVIDHRTRSGALELFNPGDRPTEVQVELVYGYPVTDAVGQFKLETPASVPAGMRAATSWLEVYPARLTIPAGGRQTVRFLARPPATLDDGEYVSRIIVTSKYAPRTDGRDSAVISTELAIEVKAVTTLLYRKGAVRTDVTIATPRIQQRGDTLDVRLAVTPSGTAAFLGTLRFELENASGTVVATHDQPVSIYVPVDPLVRMGISDVPSGQYRLRVTPRAERGDVPTGTLMPIPPRAAVVAPLVVIKP
jgi:P pilus assembly chaperone PapD